MGAAPREEWHIWWLSERVLRQSASVTSQLSDIVRVGRLTGARYVTVAHGQWIAERVQALASRKALASPASIFVKSFLLAQDRGSTSTQFRG